jgi:AbrB family looped-hinge helix DNA binding protein
MHTVTITSKFQIAIPPAVRRRLGIRPGDQLTLVELNGNLQLEPVLPPSGLRGIAKGMNTDITDTADRFVSGRTRNRSIEGALAALSKFENFPARQQPCAGDEREGF